MINYIFFFRNNLIFWIIMHVLNYIFSILSFPSIYTVTGCAKKVIMETETLS